MSHQEDADVVAVDLKRRGYTVAIRHEPQDKLFHVQIGPFATKKEADAMRQRLQTDGYNAIVKYPPASSPVAAPLQWRSSPLASVLPASHSPTAQSPEAAESAPLQA